MRAAQSDLIVRYGSEADPSNGERPGERLLMVPSSGKETTRSNAKRTSLPKTSMMAIMAFPSLPSGNSQGAAGPSLLGALLAGTGLGLLPFLIGMLFGFGGALITLLLVPAMAFRLGWRQGKDLTGGARWTAVLVAAGSAIAADYGITLLASSSNAAARQPSLIAVLTVCFLGSGWALSALLRLRPKFPREPG